MQNKYKHVLVACARWETDSIVEWLTYHRHLGFDHCYLYCNDDDPSEFYQTVLPFVQGDHPFVTFHHFGLQGQQEQMYRHFLANYIQEVEWFSCLDIDEFLLFRSKGSLAEFMSEFSDEADAVLFHMVTAGYNGHRERPPGLAIRNFTKRSERGMPWTKAVARASAFDPGKLDAALGQAWNHDIGLILRDGSRIFNVMNEDASRYYDNLDDRLIKIDNEWTVIGQDAEYQADIMNTAFVMHYWIKSEADLIRGYQRGTKGQFSYQSVLRDLGELGSEKIAEFFSGAHKAEETRLVEIWDEMIALGALKRQIVPAPVGLNLALEGRASQSSVCPGASERSADENAAGAINGRPTGRPQHQTATELDPWWALDLGATARIDEIRLFNRIDSHRDRLRNFALLGSDDGQIWRTLCVKSDNAPFGGIDGRPFIWAPDEDLELRHLKIALRGEGCIDLAQVEVYGARVGTG